jgi:hypothetical protein
MTVRHIFWDQWGWPPTETSLVSHARDIWWTLDFANAFVSPRVNSRWELVPSHVASRRRLGDNAAFTAILLVGGRRGIGSHPWSPIWWRPWGRGASGAKGGVHLAQLYVSSIYPVRWHASQARLSQDTVGFVVAPKHCHVIIRCFIKNHNISTIPSIYLLGVVLLYEWNGLSKAIPLCCLTLVRLSRPQ